MYQTSLFLAVLAVCLTSASCQVTGTYSIQLTAPAPVGTVGASLPNYPQCAENCGYSTPICAGNNVTACHCGVENRGNVSACELLTCNDAEYEQSEVLSRDNCQPFYEANPSVAVAASSAIASATAAARSALATRNPQVLTDYPLCAQRCATLSQTLCMGDPECVCHCPAVQATEAACEFANCSREDLDITTFLIYSLCRPVGGLAPKSQSACRSGNATSSESGTSPSSTGMSPPITPFTGQGSVVGATSVGVLLSVFAGAIMGLLFWL
ncbi:hypothetical protein XPA_007274 [Xanthoria parietina]